MNVFFIPSQRGRGRARKKWSKTHSQKVNIEGSRHSNEHWISIVQLRMCMWQRINGAEAKITRICSYIEKRAQRRYIGLWNQHHISRLFEFPRWKLQFAFLCCCLEFYLFSRSLHTGYMWHCTSHINARTQTMSAYIRFDPIYGSFKMGETPRQCHKNRR